MAHMTLVILAAGLGSRFGAGAGQKQVTPVDDAGQLITDFSVFDAIRAGFDKVVFVIKPESEKKFHDAIGSRIAPYIEVAYAHQTLNSFLPEGFTVPEGREKPWGTGHATLCARNCVDGPFVVINADDFYGADAYRAAFEFLSGNHADTEHAMVGYMLRNTMSPFGSVARGICSADEEHHLTGVVERTKIVQRGNDAAFTEDGENYEFISGDSIVSLNFWAFRNTVFDDMQTYFEDFLKNGLSEKPLKAEFYLPSIPNRLISEGKGTVKVLETNAKWFGMTYQEDLKNTRECIQRMKDEGAYPALLWERG